MKSAATTESRRWWWFTDENGIRRRPTWWFMLRFRWIAWRENRRDEHPEDETIRAWATYDAGAQDVGRALYVAETMIHLAILEGSDPREAVSKHLNDVRDRFAIPYAGLLAASISSTVPARPSGGGGTEMDDDATVDDGGWSFGPPGYEMKCDEGCPVAAAIEAGDDWDGGTCPECGATDSTESCFTWVPRA